MSSALSADFPILVPDLPAKRPSASESKALAPDVAGESKAHARDGAGESNAPAPEVAKPAASSQDQETSAGLLLRMLKQKYGIFHGSELGPVISRLPSSTSHLVEGLIPPRS